MNTRIKKSILAGLIGTIVMSIVMMLAPLLGMPKMSPPNMLSAMLGVPLVVSWGMHFMIGIVFAFIYTYACILKYRIKNIYAKGAAFGVIAFVVAQIMLGIMGAIFPMPKMEGSMVLVMLSSFMAHIIFGMAVSRTVGKTYASTSCSTKTA